MFDLGHPEQRSERGAAASAAFGARTLRYDPDLVADLLARHAALEGKLRSLPQLFEQDAQAAAEQGNECAEQLHELRRWEAIRLYPIVSRGLCGDAVAERQWVILRFVVNGLAHRLLCSMQALGAVRDRATGPAIVQSVLDNLSAYRSRNETDLYPLYALMDPCRTRLRA